MRDAYSEPVVGVDAAGHPVCDHSIGVRVVFPTSLRPSGQLPLLVHPKQRGAWEAFAAVMNTFGYLIRESASGTANCRNIGSEPGGRTSLHAHLSAIDLNPSANTGTDTDQPPQLRDALAAIRTNRGDQVFRNLPGDRMHWQINCGPASLATGIVSTAVPGADAGDSPRGTGLREGWVMDRETWMRVQEALQALDPPLYGGKEIDGVPGRNTNTAVRAFEKRAQLAERGVMGPLGEPTAGMWPATREILFALTLMRRDSA